MDWSKKLIVGENAKKKARKYRWKINHRAGVLDVYLLVYNVDSPNQLEILDAAMLKQKGYPKDGLTVIGMAKGYDEALTILNDLTQRVYDETGDADIRKYLQENYLG